MYRIVTSSPGFTFSRVPLWPLRRTTAQVLSNRNARAVPLSPKTGFSSSVEAPSVVGTIPSTVPVQRCTFSVMRSATNSPWTCRYRMTTCSPGRNSLSVPDLLFPVTIAQLVPTPNVLVSNASATVMVLVPRTVSVPVQLFSFGVAPAASGSTAATIRIGSILIAIINKGTAWLRAGSGGQTPHWKLADLYARKQLLWEECRTVKRVLAVVGEFSCAGPFGREDAGMSTGKHRAVARVRGSAP